MFRECEDAFRDLLSRMSNGRLTLHEKTDVINTYQIHHKDVGLVAWLWPSSGKYQIIPILGDQDEAKLLNCLYNTNILPKRVNDMPFFHIHIKTQGDFTTTLKAELAELESRKKMQKELYRTPPGVIKKQVIKAYIAGSIIATIITLIIIYILHRLML